MRCEPSGRWRARLGRPTLPATLLGLLALVVVACTPGVPEPQAPVDTGEQWRLVFSDEFERGGLGDIWRTCYWWQVDGGCTIATNAELEWYRPEAVGLADGSLVLTADAIPQRTTTGDTLPYRSGMVSTGARSSHRGELPSFAFTYGFVEARVRLPVGAGTWPAIWLLSADNRSLPEIDIAEWYGIRPDLVTMHVHQRVDGVRRSQRVELATGDISGTWRVFGMHWSPEAVVFYVDGVEAGRVTDPALVPTTPMYLLLNLAVGGGRAGTPDPAAFPTTFAVDHVRVWQSIGGS